MKKQLFYIFASSMMLTSCHIYSNYERPTNLPTDSLYRDTASVGVAMQATDTINFGNTPWREVFTDPKLQSLIEEALANNTDMRTAALSVEQAEAGLMTSRLAYFPSLSFSPTGTVSKVEGNAATKSYSIPLQASWQVDLFGSLRNDKRMAEASLMQTKAYQQVTQTQIIASVANMYYTLLMLDEQLKLTKETSEIWKQNVEAMELMLQAGGITNAAAVSQSKGAYYEVLTTIPTLEQNIRSTENSLSTLLHRSPGPIDRGTFADQSFPASMSQGVPVQLLENRPDVKAAEMSLQAAFYQTNKAYSAFYPNITINGTLGWSNQALGIIKNPADFLVQAVGSLVQPLFQKGQLRANLKISKAQQETALLNFEQSLLNAGEEVSNALTSYQTAIDQECQRVKQVEALQDAYDQTEYLFSHGNTTTYLEKLTAQQSLLSAQLSLISDRFDKMQAVVSLYQALGGGRDSQ